MRILKGELLIGRMRLKIGGESILVRFSLETMRGIGDGENSESGKVL